MSYNNTQYEILKKQYSREVKNVQFGVLSPDEIRSMSVVKVEHKDLYENKDPKIGGLCDPRMGCVERNMECYTCGFKIDICPGHFGHIELNAPMFHVGFIKVVKKILECVCHKCGRFRLLPTDQRYKKLQKVSSKFDYAWEFAKTKMVCEYPDCESQLLPLRRQNITLYLDPKKIDKKAERIYISAAHAREILCKISDDTCRLIGLDPEKTRPEWMIVTVLPVPPPCVRPSVTMDTQGRGEDDLTSTLKDIINTNINLKKHMDSSHTKIVNEIKTLLQIYVCSYIDNDVSGLPQAMAKGGRPYKSISARWKGKEGRIRGHLMGKRVDFSARTVITGDPNISIEEVGVPKSVAKNLTFPETVNRLNIHKMQELVDRSPEYPSAKFVILESGKGNRIFLERAKKKPKLHFGDIVERHMVTGDIVLFNRQPTLHKMSMMAHIARVLDYSTFRLNVNVCQSYNADFDVSIFVIFFEIVLSMIF